ncbi:MAG: DUF4214 domain-containing protein [Candidatus Competibacteraceae bacterium]|nr:DUF4214 domain-containing protein [Candidatus Competibacteraceae bacterium]MCP5126593.1 DUF4214 domain-containing protein [Gammaproteobacteria bacterium]
MQYDEPITGGEFDNLLDQNPGVSESTKNAIEQVLGITDPSEPINVASATFDPETGELTVVQPSGQVNVLIVDLSGATEGQVIQLNEALSQANVLIIDSDVSVTLTIGGATASGNDDGIFAAKADFNTVDRVIVSGNGDDIITVSDNSNTTLEGGSGNDTLTTSGGNDSVTGGTGNDSVSAGAGDDTIVSGSGSDTVDAGAGYDLLQMSGSKSSYNITVQDGALVIAGANNATVSNAEYISFTDGGSMTVSGDVNVAAAMRMYESLLERSAEPGGAEFWAEAAASGSWTTAQIAEFFLHSDEFQSKFGNPDDLTNEQFVRALYENSLGREAEQEGLDFWVNVLETDAYSRSQVTVFISGSPEAANYHSDTVQFIEGWI